MLACGRCGGLRGFRTDPDDIDKYNEFLVVDAQQSLAARRQFTVQIGLITTAFHAPQSEGRGPGTDKGKEGREKVEVRKGMKCGNQLGIVHIRYVDPGTLGAIK